MKINKIYFAILFFAYIGICIDCQGAGKRSKHNSKYNSHSYHHHSYHHHSYSHGYGHRHGGGTGVGASEALAIVGVGVVIIIIVIIYYICEYCSSEVGELGEPDENNTEFVFKNTQQQEPNFIHMKTEPVESNAGFVSTNYQQIEQDTNLFESGIWLSNYKQDDQWHGPFEMSLTFNPDSPAVIGSGWDDVGFYSISGSYSHQTRRIGLTKTYQACTGNASENLGHNVTIQLSHTQNSQFEGTWYVKTSDYNGEDEFRLTRKPEYGPYGHVTNNYFAKPENYI